MSKINSFSREWAKMKEMPVEKKVQFIWDYYRWPILITVFIVVSVIATAISFSNQKDVVLFGYLLDSFYTTDNDEPFYDFPGYANLDSDNQMGQFQTNISLSQAQAETAQQVYATISAGQTDFVSSNPSTFLRLAYESNKYFADLRDVFTEEQLEALSDRLFYYDASIDVEASSDGVVLRLPDHDKPETMKDPVPIGIDIRGCRGVDPLYLGDDPVFLAVVVNAPHLDMVRTFVDYLFSEIA